MEILRLMTQDKGKITKLSRLATKTEINNRKQLDYFTITIIKKKANKQQKNTNKKQQNEIIQTIGQGKGE